MSLQVIIKQGVLSQ